MCERWHTWIDWNVRKTAFDSFFWEVLVLKFALVSMFQTCLSLKISDPPKQKRVVRTYTKNFLKGKKSEFKSTFAKVNYCTLKQKSCRLRDWWCCDCATLLCTPLSTFSFISSFSFHVCLSAQCWEVWSHAACWGRSVTCWRWFWRGWTACPNSTTPPPPTHGAWMSSALLLTGVLAFFFIVWSCCASLCCFY